MLQFYDQETNASCTQPRVAPDVTMYKMICIYGDFNAKTSVAFSNIIWSNRLFKLAMTKPTTEALNFNTTANKALFIHTLDIWLITLQGVTTWFSLLNKHNLMAVHRDVIMLKSWAAVVKLYSMLDSGQITCSLYHFVSKNSLILFWNEVFRFVHLRS